jgi:hypothetical protein
MDAPNHLALTAEIIVSTLADMTVNRLTTNHDDDHGVTLKVLDSDELAGWTGSAANNEQNAHCLLYLVALGPPKILSTRARRLRLKNSLDGRKASLNASILARDAHFWDYLQQINLTAYDAEIDACRARHFINRVCGVNSRLDLDRYEAVSQRFYNLIERPFLDWLLAGDDD